MATSVVTVDRITPYKEIARLLTQHRVSALPVLSMGRHVAGVVSEADLVALQDEAGWHARVGDGSARRWPHRTTRHTNLTAGELMTAPVLREVFGTDGTDVTIAVRNGIVTINGPGETLPPVADRLIWGVDGVVDVVRRLGESAA